MRTAVFLTIWLVAIAIAMTRGKSPERLGAAILLGMAPLQIALRAVFPLQYDNIDPATLLTDAVAAIAFLAVALHANRIWPLWTCALQLIVLIGHAVRYLDIAAPPGAYGVMIKAPTYLQCLILIGGTHRSRQIASSTVSYPSWRISSPLLNRKAATP